MFPGKSNASITPFRKWGDTLLGALFRPPGNGRASQADRRRGSGGGPWQTRLALDPPLVLEAEAGVRPLFQALGLDRPAAGFADPVGVLLQPLEGRLDLPELGFDLLEDGGVLLVLEDLRGDVTWVLVVVGLLRHAGELRRRLGVPSPAA